MKYHYPSAAASERGWIWAVLALGSLLLLGQPIHVPIYNGPGATFYQSGGISTTGTYQNVGTYVPNPGTLTLPNGDVLNTGAISTETLVSTSAHAGLQRAAGAEPEPERAGRPDANQQRPDQQQPEPGQRPRAEHGGSAPR